MLIKPDDSPAAINDLKYISPNQNSGHKPAISSIIADHGTERLSPSKTSPYSSLDKSLVFLDRTPEQKQRSPVQRSPLQELNQQQPSPKEKQNNLGGHKKYGHRQKNSHHPDTDVKMPTTKKSTSRRRSRASRSINSFNGPKSAHAENLTTDEPVEKVETMKITVTTMATLFNNDPNPAPDVGPKSIFKSTRRVRTPFANQSPTITMDTSLEQTTENDTVDRNELGTDDDFYANIPARTSELGTDDDFYANTPARTSAADDHFYANTPARTSFSGRVVFVPDSGLADTNTSTPANPSGPNNSDSAASTLSSLPLLSSCSAYIICVDASRAAWTSSNPRLRVPC